MTLVDLEKLARTITAFYNSTLQTQNIIVTIGSPINDQITITLTRESSNQATYQKAYKKIQHYLSSYKKLKQNSTGETHACSNHTDLTHTLHKLKAKDFSKHVINHGISGHYKATNS
jgi:hypothetical protein